MMMQQYWHWTFLSFDRRLRTGRDIKDGREANVESGKLPWLPMDERFNSIKFSGMIADSNNLLQY